MSVLIETTLGNLEIYLYTEDCPRTCLNFLKLCKTKYYNNCLFFNVQKNFIAQTGDPTGTGKGGSSIFGKLYGSEARFFNDEIVPTIKHDKKGILAMSNPAPNKNGSQFYITLRDKIDFLDKHHTIFGYVTEGMDIVDKINQSFVDGEYRPYVDIRILHTHIIYDPYDDPTGLEVPDSSPTGDRPKEETVHRGLKEEDLADKYAGMTAEQIDDIKRKEDINSHALALEILGDLPDKDIEPPKNVIFVAKLNPCTEDEDLKLIFFRYGVKSCEIIRDKKTGDSLCYGFIEMETEEGAENAVLKMNNILIDDRRIFVDFSQSVSKLWGNYKRGGQMTKNYKKDSDYQDSSKSHSTSKPYTSSSSNNNSNNNNSNRHNHNSHSRHNDHYHHRSRSDSRGYSRDSSRDRSRHSRRSDRHRSRSNSRHHSRRY
ncbi:hypothetical protein WA158_001404 [Blastocystis sp. Blastoise]